ncbi:MAG: apolipoprotein N-acyltransferase [Desulfuromonadaceae bacterium GWC2_58_13]|nr:MAG: apolipoprotein N-acyltransferase [Desulfuromonadaceae bacterium GWC2_58_13]
MKRFLPERVSCWAVLSGILLALAFPRVNQAWLAWLALVPLLQVMSVRPFRSGFMAGLGFFGLVLYWLNIVMTTYGGLAPILSLAAYLMLVAYLALFFGAATWACCRLQEKLALPPMLTLPVLWVSLEFLRSFLFTGFPWATLGYSQQAYLPLIQSADLFGVYGISFLLVFSNALLSRLWDMGRRKQLRELHWIGPVLGLLLIAGNYGYGVWRLGQPPAENGKKLQVALIQGNIDQSVKWDPAFQKSTVDIYRDLSLAASAETSPDLLIWPESATPFYFQESGPLHDEVVAVSRATGRYLLFGSPAFEIANRRYRYLNSSFILDPNGDIQGRSDKVHLVPFGEYVPLGRLLPFINKLVAGIGDFSPGMVNPLPMNGEQIGVLVCFEGIFPELARDYVRQGSDLLVNITNDAWFGKSSAPFQHLAMIRFRAVENRIWVARAANTGISAFIAPTGRITDQTSIFTSGFLRGEVMTGARLTLYNRIGDLLPVLFLFLGIFWLIKTRRRFI